MHIFLIAIVLACITTSTKAELYPVRANEIPKEKAVVVERITPPPRPNEDGITCIIVLRINDTLHAEAIRIGTPAYMYLPESTHPYTPEEIVSMIDIDACRWRQKR